MGRRCHFPRARASWGALPQPASDSGQRLTNSPPLLSARACAQGGGVRATPPLCRFPSLPAETAARKSEPAGLTLCVSRHLPEPGRFQSCSRVRRGRGRRGRGRSSRFPLGTRRSWEGRAWGCALAVGSSWGPRGGPAAAAVGRGCPSPNARLGRSPGSSPRLPNLGSLCLL